ncbi:MAG: DUF4091 domain-containing protein [Acidiferrobacter sp.]
MKRWSLIVVLMLSGMGGAHATVAAWLTHATHKIRPDVPAHTVPNLFLFGARGQYVAYQISFRSPQPFIVARIIPTPLENVTSVIGVTQMTVYREAYIRTVHPTNIVAAVGLWPDALIPTVDNYYHERRDALPWPVAAHFTQSFWVEVYIPHHVHAGLYREHVTVFIHQGGHVERHVLDVRLHVFAFSIPATSSLPSSFGFDGAPLSLVFRGHYGLLSNDQLMHLTQLFDIAALKDRIALSGGSGIPAPMTYQHGHLRMNWHEYDEEVRPFMIGCKAAHGARWRMTDVRWTSHVFDHKMPPREQAQYFRAWARHFRKEHWPVPLYALTVDEPHSVAQFRAANRRAATMRRLTKAVLPLVTTDHLHRLDLRNFGIICPVINDMEGLDNINNRGRYARYAHRYHFKTWWYQSCMSHGCWVVGGRSTLGWPSYMIDQPAIYNRIMPWLSWKYGLQGELYYDTDVGFSRGRKNPWTDQYHFGGNGDGTLFYPGTPAVIGGQRDIPIQSIRLMMIRAGYQDYEYLHLASRLYGRARIEDVIGQAIVSTHDWTHSPRILRAVRWRLATMIVKRIGQRAAPANGDPR